MAVVINKRVSKRGSTYYKHIHIDDQTLMQQFTDIDFDEIISFWDMFVDSRAEQDFEEIYVRDLFEKLCQKGKLNEFEKTVLKLRLDGYTTAEIARILNVPRHRVDYMLQARIIRKLAKANALMLLDT